MKKILLVVGLALTGCADPGADSNATQAAPVPIAQANPDSAAQRCAQFVNNGLKLRARTRPELRAEAGAPLKTNVAVEPNRHVPDVQDSIIQLDYADGLQVQLRKPGGGNDMIEHIVLTEREWLNYPFFAPGVSASNVVAAMGEPQRRHGDDLVYICGGGEVDEPVVFSVQNGTVTALTFNFYVD